MCRFDLLQDRRQLIVEDPPEIFVLVDLRCLQRPHGQALCIGMVSLFQLLPGGFYHGIHVPDAVTDQPVHTDLKVGHPPGKIGMFQKLTQQPMIESSIP